MTPARLPVAGPQVSAILDLTAARRGPRGRVAAHLEEGHLLCGGSGHFVLLGGHVVGVLLVGEAVVGERERQEVGGAHHALVEVRGRGGRQRGGHRELTGQRGVG